MDTRRFQNFAFRMIAVLLTAGLSLPDIGLAAEVFNNKDALAPYLLTKSAQERRDGAPTVRNPNNAMNAYDVLTAQMAIAKIAGDLERLKSRGRKTPTIPNVVEKTIQRISRGDQVGRKDLQGLKEALDREVEKMSPLPNPSLQAPKGRSNRLLFSSLDGIRVTTDKTADGQYRVTADIEEGRLEPVLNVPIVDTGIQDAAGAIGDVLTVYGVPMSGENEIVKALEELATNASVMTRGKQNRKSASGDSNITPEEDETPIATATRKAHEITLQAWASHTEKEVIEAILHAQYAARYQAVLELIKRKGHGGAVTAVAEAEARVKYSYTGEYLASMLERAQEAYGWIAENSARTSGLEPAAGGMVRESASGNTSSTMITLSDKHTLALALTFDGTTPNGRDAYTLEAYLITTGVRRYEVTFNETDNVRDKVNGLLSNIEAGEGGQLAEALKAKRDKLTAFVMNRKARLTSAKDSGEPSDYVVAGHSVRQEVERLGDYLGFLNIPLARNRSFVPRPLILAFDTDLLGDEGREAAIEAEHRINQYLAIADGANMEFVAIRDTGKALLQKVREEKGKLEGRSPAIVTIVGDRTMSLPSAGELKDKGFVLHIAGADGCYVPVSGLHNLALSIAYGDDYDILDALKIMEKALAKDGDGSFAMDDIGKFLTERVIKLLPRIKIIETEERRQANDAAKAYLTSL